MKATKAMLADLKKTLHECNLLLSVCHNCKYRCNYECRNCSIKDTCKDLEYNKTMVDKKTEWSIFQDLKKLGIIDDSNDKQ